MLETNAILAHIASDYTEVRQCLRRLRHHQSAELLAELQRISELHQRRFTLAYGNCERPKHHYRLHHSEQISRLGYADCWASETKHRAYKRLEKIISNQYEERSGKSACETLPRLLHATISELDTTPWSNRMHPPIYKEDLVKSVTGMNNCQISIGYHFHNQLLKANSILFLDNDAGLIHFFCQHDNEMFVVIEILQCVKPFTHLSVSSKWKLSNKRLAVKLHSNITISSPLWWCRESDTILCLH